MKKELFKLLFLMIIAGVIFFLAFYWKDIRGLKPALLPPPSDIVKDMAEEESSPLSLPEGFTIEVFASDLAGARVMLFDTLGNMWVAQTKEGNISLLELDEEGSVIRQNVIFTNLSRPHGLAIDPDDPFVLYIAEEDKISRVRIYSDGELEKIVDLPAGGNHFTRTIGFGADNRLYVSIGSSCDSCDEKDQRRGAIYSMNKDGSNFRQFAAGLRNAVFFIFDSVGQMWATEMGRDRLGDDLPPDEINIVRENSNYGWPNCYGKNILDTRFHKDDHVHIRAHCTEPFETPSYIDIPAHSSPLGLAFYQGDLLVAYHGSWNRTVPTGYKVVRMVLNDSGNYIETQDFVTGWLTDKGALGRPVDIKINGGDIYISDDHAGVIYKVTYQGTRMPLE